MFPWLVFLKKAGKKLSDIEFLAIKEFDGKLVSNTDIQDDGATGNTATLTASSGKDLYLAKAQVTVRCDTTTSLVRGDISLKANAVGKDRWRFSFVAGTESGQIAQTHDFVVEGIKVAATQTIILDVVFSNVDFDITGTLVGFEEDTGSSPAV